MKGYLTHYRLAHGCLPPEFPEDQKFICDLCSKEFGTKKSLDEHVIKHQTRDPGKKVFNCEDCKESFKSFSLYMVHYRHIHKSLPPEFKDQYVCENCGKVFTEESLLKAHIKITHGEKGKKQKSRSGRPLLPCPECSKVFKGKTGFDEHVRSVHENNTPHACEQCPKKFALKKTLHNHMIDKHTRVNCDICNKELYCRSNLKKHKFEAHGYIPKGAFQCKLCPMFYTLPVYLEQHISLKHSS